MARYVIPPSDRDDRSIIQAPRAEIPAIKGKPTQREHRVHGLGIEDGAIAVDLVSIGGWVRNHKVLMGVAAASLVTLTWLGIECDRMTDELFGRSPTPAGEHQPAGGAATSYSETNSTETFVRSSPPITPVTGPPLTESLSDSSLTETSTGSPPPRPEWADNYETFLWDDAAPTWSKNNCAFNLAKLVISPDPTIREQALDIAADAILNGPPLLQGMVASNLFGMVGSQMLDTLTPDEIKYVQNMAEHALNETDMSPGDKFEVIKGLDMFVWFSPDSEAGNNAQRILEDAEKSDDPYLAKKAKDKLDGLAKWRKIPGRIPEEDKVPLDGIPWLDSSGNSLLQPTVPEHSSSNPPDDVSIPPVDGSDYVHRPKINVSDDDIVSGDLGDSLITANDAVRLFRPDTRSIEEFELLTDAFEFLAKVIVTSPDEGQVEQAYSTLITGLELHSPEANNGAAATLLAIFDMGTKNPALYGSMPVWLVPSVCISLDLAKGDGKQASAAVLEFLATEHPNPDVRDEVSNELKGIVREHPDEETKAVALQSIRNIEDAQP